MHTLPLRSLLAFALCATGLTAGCTSEPPTDAPDAFVPMDPDAAAPGGGDAGAGMGSDDAGAPDSGVDAGPPPAMCPPSGPYGPDAGDVAQELVLMDCDGVEHSLHSLCDREVTWIFELADWCPPCRSFARDDANRIYDRFVAEHGDAFAGWMIVSEDMGFDPADAADCAAIRERYGIHMPVLIDPTGAFQDQLDVASNEVHVVLTEGAVIDWKGHYAGDRVEGRIEGAFAR